MPYYIRATERKHLTDADTPATGDWKVTASLRRSCHAAEDFVLGVIQEGGA
jgi:hypothetical protein